MASCHSTFGHLCLAWVDSSEAAAMYIELGVKDSTWNDSPVLKVVLRCEPSEGVIKRKQCCVKLHVFNYPKLHFIS